MALGIDLLVAQTEAVAAVDEPAGPRFRAHRRCFAVFVCLDGVFSVLFAVVVDDRLVPSLRIILEFKRIE